MPFMLKSAGATLLLVLVALTGCESGPEGPDPQTFKTALMLEVGSVYEVNDVDIVIHQAVGNSGDTRVRTRLEAGLSLQQPLYIRVGELTVPAGNYQSERSYQLLRLSRPAGSKMHWKGTAESVKTQEQWQVLAIQQDELSPPADGQPLATIRGQYLIQGSEEELRVQAEIRQLQQKEQELAEQRRQAEEEAARKKQEQYQQQLAALKLVRQQATGTWKTVRPVLADDAVFSVKGVTLGYEITIPDNDLLEGMASVTVIPSQPMKGQPMATTFEALFRFEAGQSSFKLYEVEGHELRVHRKRWYSGKKWTVTPNGKALQAVSDDRQLKLRMELEKVL